MIKRNIMRNQADQFRNLLRESRDYKEWFDWKEYNLLLNHSDVEMEDHWERFPDHYQIVVKFKDGSEYYCRVYKGKAHSEYVVFHSKVS